MGQTTGKQRRNNGQAKAILYARFSPRPSEEREKQLRRERPEDLEDTISKQLERCRAWCLTQGLAVAGEREDAALSGAEHDRPGLWEAVQLLRPGWVLVVYKLDRLSRDATLSAYLRVAVAKRRARILSTLGEGTEDDSPQSQLLRGLIEVLAGYQRELTRARTRCAMLQHQAKGRRMSGEAPFGWRPDPADGARLAQDLAEQATLARARQLVAGGLSVRAVGRQLDAEGRRPRHGLAWHHKVLAAALERTAVPVLK